LQNLLNFLVIGISVGSIYALIALGYTMVYGIVKLINFAHADILMLGAYMGYFVMINLGVSIWAALLALVAAFALCAFIGVTMEKTCYKPLRDAPRLNALITAIGVSMFIENGSKMLPFIGPDYRQYPQLSSQVMSVFKTASGWVNDNIGITITPIQILVIIVSVLLMLVLNYIVNYTRTGKTMRAVSYDMGAAKLMGIPVDKVISTTFALGAALAAAAGILYSMSFPQINPYMGIMPGLKCFIAAVLGGIGSIPGAMLGGLLIGIVESLTKGYISSLWSDGIVFGILIVILFVRPSGIMGKRSREKV
jgi:branched-chain amino acid transport system permease protein